MTNDFLRAIAALILVMGLLAGCVWAGRYLLTSVRQRRMAGNSSAAPVILGGAWLDTKRKLVTVRWGNRDFLICIGPQGEQRIASRPTPDDSP